MQKQPCDATAPLDQLGSVVAELPFSPHNVLLLIELNSSFLLVSSQIIVLVKQHMLRN